jgi:DNA-binding beta-propeller fold protein YncE
MEKMTVLLISTLALTLGSPVMTRQGLLRQKNREQFCSNLLNFNNFYYSMDESKNVTGIPADMSIHWKTGKVFFTLISEEMKMSLQVMQPSGEFETIKVAGLGQSTSVDNLNDIVYLATDNGVYKYKEDGSIELYTALGEDVMYIALTSDGTAMYIATWPQNRVHKITNDGQKMETFSAVPNGHGLTIDTRNNIFFVATKTSYILKNGLTVSIKIKGLPSDKMIGVFVSRSDEVFGMDEDSNLYVIDSEAANARHLGSFNITGVNSFAMDSADNVLIGVKGAIVKFNAYERNPCSDFDK